MSNKFYAYGRYDIIQCTVFFNLQYAYKELAPEGCFMYFTIYLN